LAVVTGMKKQNDLAESTKVRKEEKKLYISSSTKNYLN